MVHLELGQSNAGLLSAARDMADRFRSAVIGVVACQPIENAYSDNGYSYTSGDVVVAERQEIEHEIAAAEAEFRDALQPRAERVEWRSAFGSGSTSRYLAAQARCADLIITGVSHHALLDPSRHTDTADLIMQAGRPVLVVPPRANALRLEQVIVGWKDTREARRAALDALPLLKRAGHVAVVEIAAERQLEAARARLDDVVAWLKSHGVTAVAIAAPSSGADAACLDEIVQRQGADLIVAGAYGHNRIEESVLGGVTRDFILCADSFSLVSH